MHVFTKRTLRGFALRNPDAQRALDTWYRIASTATWNSPDDVAAEITDVRFIAGDRAIFNIRNNRFRLIVHIRYGKGRLYIRFIGTHQEYDKIDPHTI